MAHDTMKNFINGIKLRFPFYFKNVRVLDFGSLDINGNNKEFFENIDYVGVDIGEGKNVDVVSLAHEYKSDTKFDVVITTELLEHDIFWKQTFLNGFNLLNPNGLYIFTCAGYGREEHGTKLNGDTESPFTSKISVWENYYENKTTRDFINLLDFEKEFQNYLFEYNGNYDNFCGVSDLYFFGIKRSSIFQIALSKNRFYIKVKNDVNIENKEFFVIMKKNNVIEYSSIIQKDLPYWLELFNEIKVNDQIIIEIYDGNILLEKRIF